jgi:membrane glycosyltransferase
VILDHSLGISSSLEEAHSRHNAFIRWSALQEMLWIEDGQKKWWSESHVSEDFEMSLKLQKAGWRVRYATYCGEAFREGVSLTVYDELARWEKYSYGCVSEYYRHV